MGTQYQCLILAAFLTACVPAQYPPAANDCAAACAHLRELRCETGEPTPGGATCEQVCEAGPAFPLACMTRVDSCEAADACETEDL